MKMTGEIAYKAWQDSLKSNDIHSLDDWEDTCWQVKAAWRTVEETLYRQFHSDSSPN